MKKILSLVMVFLIAFSTISFAMPKARAETEFPRPALPDGPTHTNELVEVITANTTKVLIVTEGWGPLTGVSPIEEKDFWVNVLSEMSGDFDVDWFDGVPSFEKLQDYDLVIYDAGGYWYPLSHVATPLRQYHFTRKPLIVVTPDINYDWLINGEPVPSFTRDVLHIQGVLGIMPAAVYDVYADTGHEIVHGIPKDVGIGVPAVTSWPDCFEPKADCDSVLRQSYIPETEFGVGTCSELPSYSPYDPAGKLFAFVAYPGSDTEGRVVTYGVPISGLENTKIAKQLASSTIEWALQEELLDIDLTLYIEDADPKTLVNKAPGDKIDIVAAVLNNEENPYEIDVVVQAPADLSLETVFPRKNFASTEDFQYPSTIRVLRTGSGEIEVVDFKDYVKNVLPNEWIASWNMDALKAGAMAVKTYGWYWTIHQKYPGMAYDVRDDESDQVYKPSSAHPRTDQAIEETWDWIMIKDGNVFQAQYDSGTEGSPDPLNTGRMSQWGTQYWAENGKDWRWILHYYYDPVNVLCLLPTIDNNKYMFTISLAGKESLQVVFRFDISKSASTGSKLVSGATKVDGKVCSSATAKYDVVSNVAAIIVTNRHLLYKKYDSTEIKSLLKYLFEIADGNSDGELSCIIHYVDHYDNALKNWDQNVNYQDEHTANLVASTIDELIEDWNEQTDPEYIVIVGGDEIIPFYRLDDSNYYDTADNHPYNSDDPVLHTFDENYFLSDNPYADTSGNDYDEGKLELSIGRIVGYSAQDMKNFITAGLSGPEDLDIAIVMHDEAVDDAVDALDEKASSIAQSDTWTDDELEQEMEQGFQILYCVCHGEYYEISAVGGGTLDDDEMDDVDSAGGISNNRPLTIFDACRVGVVTDEDEDQWIPEWDDCMIYALVHQGCSGVVAAGGKAIFDYGIKLTNDFISRLITGDQESLAFGTGLRDAKVHYDKGLSWSGGEKKTVTEFIYYGIPWTTIDPQSTSQESDSSVLINISNPSYVSDENYAREIEINATDFVVSMVNGFDLIEINGAQQALDEQRPVIPTVEVALSLPLDSNVVDIIPMNDVRTLIGFYNIPSFISAEKPEESIFVSSAGLGFYPSPTYSIEIVTSYHQKIAKIRIALVQYNPETQETIFYNYTKLQVTYQTSMPLTIRELALEKKEYTPSESIDGLVIVESVASEAIYGLYVNLALKDSYGNTVASALSAPFDLMLGEIKEISLSLTQELQHGTYLLEAKVVGSILATSSMYISILSGEIVSFDAPAQVKLGDDIVFEVSFFNGKSVYVFGESIIYLYNPHDVEIAELYSAPTTFPPNSMTQIQITWNTAGKECGTYTASAIVYAGGESFGPVHHLFSIKPPDEIPPTTSLTISSPQYVDALGNVYINSSTTLTLNAIDNGGTGSGVALTGYKIYDTSYDSGWIIGSPPISFQIGGLDDGLYYVDYNSTDNVGNIEETNTTALILDNTGPLITVSNPPAGWALQDGVTFLGFIIDDSGSGVFSMSFSIREANDGEGTPIGFEDLPVSYDPGTGEWSFSFDTLLVPDGYYVLYIEAEDNLGNRDSTTVPYSIRNWAVIELLPSSEDNKAGRTMPVKFALRVVAEVDPAQPFVYNEELRIEIYGTDNPTEILQESYFGDTARDYRISSVLYITNFKTVRTPMEYTVTVYRDTFDVGSFTFETVK